MSERPKIILTAVMLDCEDPFELATFYARLLGGKVEKNSFTDEWLGVSIPGMPYMPICCQREAFYKPPVWPATNGNGQLMMAHLDFAVANLEQAVSYALSLGATIADAQFSPPGWIQPWTTLLDPAGHPFCLTQKDEIDRDGATKPGDGKL